jgi:probable HAF family extracellular repeat protein
VKKKGIALCIALAALSVSQAIAFPSPRYRIVSITVADLGTLGGPESIAHDVNNAGVIVGESDTAAGVRHAFAQSAGPMIDIGATMGGTNWAYGINNSNHVVGARLLGPQTLGFRRIGAVVEFLRDPAYLGEVNTFAYAISDTGRIVGHSRIPFAEARARLWTNPTTFYDLPPPAATARDTFAYDINSSDVVVGYDRSGTGRMKRWQWSPTGTTTSSVPVFCDLESVQKAARGINAAGKIVGHAESCDGTAQPHSLQWSGTSTYSTDRRVLPGGTQSFSEDINNLDFMTGYANKWVAMPWPFVGAYLEFAYLYHWDLGVGWIALPRPAGMSRYGACRGHALNDRNSTNLIRVVGYCDFPTGKRAQRWDIIVEDVVY